jgi:hypothetical protein
MKTLRTFASFALFAAAFGLLAVSGNPLRG